jgi:hypothetical protein
MIVGAACIISDHFVVLRGWMMFDLLLERALNGLLLEGVHKFSSVQFDVKGGLRKKILSFVRGLPAGALAGDGRETRPHITVKYGLHTSDPAVVEEVISGCKPFTVKLGKLSAYPIRIVVRKCHSRR